MAQYLRLDFWLIQTTVQQGVDSPQPHHNRGSSFVMSMRVVDEVLRVAVDVPLDLRQSDAAFVTGSIAKQRLKLNLTEIP